MFDKNLKKLREKQGMSQAELGLLVGVSQVAVTKYERGDALPNAKVAVRIARVLHTTVEQLVTVEL